VINAIFRLKVGLCNFEPLNCIHIFIVTGSFFVLMCHEAGQSAFPHTQFYLSTNLDNILLSNVSWH